MNDEQQFAYKVRQALNRSVDDIDRSIRDKLYGARQKALSHQRIAVAGLSLAGVGHIASDAMMHHARTVAALLALVIGASGAYLWTSYQQATENEEIDSALLSDDLPINAYLDRGFRAWLDRSSSSQQ